MVPPVALPSSNVMITSRFLGSELFNWTSNVADWASDTMTSSTVRLAVSSFSMVPVAVSLSSTPSSSAVSVTVNVSSSS